ncbi:MAG: sugar phosphate isomerase/epimerase family protein [Planctomycetaceae bacterium]|nr:sugar phosphate isomerase/epimerase family protein [Planctomycetaceae bacterium]
MLQPVSRRDVLRAAVAAAGACVLPRFGFAQQKSAPLFRISLAQWSLNKAFFGKSGATKRDPLDFAKISKEEFGIDAIEYVNQFYKDKKADDATLHDLKKRADDLGVKSLLIMCDGEGNLGDPDEAKRTQAVENHYRWVEWAKHLGCHSIRVNAASSGSYREQIGRAADGLRKLTEFAEPYGIGVIVENHGGLSSNGAWLAEVMRKVDHPGCGTLPDFGNFNVAGPKIWYDRYQGVNDLMPFAKGVSAKSYEFDAEGNDTKTDYRKMLQIVLSFGYRGYIGIEYEGSQLGEADGIIATKKLLETVRAEMS